MTYLGMIGVGDKQLPNYIYNKEKITSDDMVAHKNYINSRF